MICNYHGIDFDTDTMAAFSTNVSCMPTIFVNDNRAAFLEMRRPGWEAPRVRHLNRSEAIRLATTYNLPALKEFLAAPRGTPSQSSSNPSMQMAS